MIRFDPNPSVPGTEYHDIIIDDPLLTGYGFAKFSLPINDNALKMILYNDKDHSMITYVDFDKHNLDRSVQLLYDKLVEEQEVESKAGEDIFEGLVAYFRNIGVSLQEDPDNEFFKNGNGNAKKSKSNKKSRKKSNSGGSSDYKEQDQKPSRPAFLTCENGKVEPYSIVEEDIRVIKPPHPENYPYGPYEFENMDEVLI